MLVTWEKPWRMKMKWTLGSGFGTGRLGESAIPADLNTRGICSQHSQRIGGMFVCTFERNILTTESVTQSSQESVSRDNVPHYQ